MSYVDAYFTVDYDVEEFDWNTPVRPEHKFIPLVDLVASQSHYDEDRLVDLRDLHMLDDAGEIEPIVVTPRDDGKYTIRDGHHRAILAVERGNVHISAFVYSTKGTMSMSKVNGRSGKELAEYLAITLSDLEFELLLRERIRREFNNAVGAMENLSEHHHRCEYQHSWGDEPHWEITVGETYSKYGNSKGEVLSKTVVNAVNAYLAKNDNKLSLLLAAPTPDPDLKW